MKIYYIVKNSDAKAAKDGVKECKCIEVNKESGEIYV